MQQRVEHVIKKKRRVRGKDKRKESRFLLVKDKRYIWPSEQTGRMDENGFLTLNPPRLPVCDMSRLRITAAERRRPSEIRSAGYLILIELLDKSRWAEATFTESPPISPQKKKSL